MFQCNTLCHNTKCSLCSPLAKDYVPRCKSVYIIVCEQLRLCYAFMHSFIKVCFESVTRYKSLLGMHPLYLLYCDYMVISKISNKSSLFDEDIHV